MIFLKVRIVINMFNPNNKNNRLYYGSILSPKDNYEMDFAIATTYSLDLDSLIGACISLGLSEDMDSELFDNSIFLLEALRKTSDDIAVFCESGQIKLPSNRNSLYILLENSVFQVKTTKEFQKNKYSSFHPKIWLLRYINNEGKILYKIIILSRNLTFDRSWDITFTMEGEKSENTSNKNDALINFIEYLINHTTDSTKAKKMKNIVDELKYIHFTLDSPFDNFEFFVNGINEKFSINNSSLFGDELDELLIISPFLSNSVISDFNNRKRDNSHALLFTRLPSLSKLKYDDCNNFDIFTLKDEIIDGESIVSEDSQETSKQDIHAKLYFIKNKKYSELYLGSLNASHNALYGNIEFMIKLESNNYSLNQITKDLFNGEMGNVNDPFKLVNINQIVPEETESKQLDLIIKYISRLNSKAKIISYNDYFNIELEFDNLNYDYLKDYSIRVRPLLSKKESNFSKSMKFEELSKLDLSEFFVIIVYDEENMVSRVIKIKSEGMPIDRKKDVISNIIKDEKSFIEYVSFLLGDDFILTAIENKTFENSLNGINTALPELYEKMLKAACHSPEKFNEIEFLISALSDDNVIPNGFEELYNTFLKVID